MPTTTFARARLRADWRATPRPAPPTPTGQPDRVLLGTVAALLALGLLMVLSASQLSVASDPWYWFRKQALYAVVGLVALAIVARVDYHWWQRVTVWGMLATLALLLVVLVVGQSAYGAQRWLNLGIFTFQPSEVAKLALALYLAHWLTGRDDQVRRFRDGLLPFAAMTGLVLALVLRQNDLGTAVVIAAMAVTLFVVAGANLLWLAPALAMGAGALALLVARSGVRRARLDAWLHPLPPGCADAASYQLCQGLISLGSGGWFGRGLGASLQKAGYLPNPFTDSIFAVIGEELGLMGCLLTLALFATLAFRGLRVCRRAPDRYGALLACGITTWLVAQALINVGSVVDAIPFTGVPLPLVSYGGSSLVVSLAAVGILLNISRTARRV
ncbi:MAG TPA: putative lipid II flippase FtsW [Ktedonobacterales bacterium]